jgi:hypothetical protein
MKSIKKMPIERNVGQWSESAGNAVFRFSSTLSRPSDLSVIRLGNRPFSEGEENTSVYIKG